MAFRNHRQFRDEFFSRGKDEKARLSTVDCRGMVKENRSSRDNKLVETVWRDAATPLYEG